MHIKPLNWIQWVSLGEAIAVAVLAVCVVILFARFDAAAAQNTNVLAGMICSAEKAVKQEPGVTPAQKRFAFKFYAHELAQLHRPPCKP